MQVPDISGFATSGRPSVSAQLYGGLVMTLLAERSADNRAGAFHQRIAEGAIESTLAKGRMG
jgi:hypothetical protein